MSAVGMLCLAAGAWLGAWALGRLESRRVAAARAERLARPAERAPLVLACCERWFVSRGAEHSQTCRVAGKGGG